MVSPEIARPPLLRLPRYKQGKGARQLEGISGNTVGGALGLRRPRTDLKFAEGSQCFPYTTVNFVTRRFSSGIAFAQAFFSDSSAGKLYTDTFEDVDES